MHERKLGLLSGNEGGERDGNGLRFERARLLQPEKGRA